MGKASRLRQQRRLREAVPHAKVMDAARLISMADQLAGIMDKPRPPTDPSWRAMARIAHVMLHEWRRSCVVVRADAEFAGALLDSDTDVPLVPDWLGKLPFDSFACVLNEPMSLDDGYNLCHYMGFIATGIRSRRVTETTEERYGRSWTTYGPFAEADGIRFLWLLNHHQDPAPRAQTVSVLLKGELAHEDMTIAKLVTAQQHMTIAAGQEWGQELDVLVPLSIQLALYMAAQEPDLEWIPLEHRSKHKELTATAKVGNVGWRVGAALRTWRNNPGNARETSQGPNGPSGWRLPPHIRRAHWHRVRVATRDKAGNIIGDRQGQQGIDWHYDMRWFPPTPVNVTEQSPVAPVVRELSE